MINRKLFLVLSSSLFMLWTGYSMAACTTREEVEAKSSMAYDGLYSLPEVIAKEKEYEALGGEAFDLFLDEDYSGACQLYDQMIQKIQELKASGKICTSEQVLEKIDIIFNIASQLNNLPAAQVAKFSARIDQAGKLIRENKNVEGCALYDDIIKDAAALGIKPSK